MYVIGITGGVGSGKSYAAHRLQEKLGATLLIADELGHVVMEPGKVLIVDRRAFWTKYRLIGQLDRPGGVAGCFSDASS
ncbi:MAG: dephospho-CoA kinase [Clostridium sp.]